MSEPKPPVQKPPEPLIINNFNWQIPQCCQEGWPTCPHVTKKQKPVKRNIGL